MLWKKHTIFVIISLLTLLSALLHFYNLNWGAPYYFHPDERNVASAVSQLQYPNQMNPHFFAYGSLPIYAIYYTGVLTNIVSNHPPVTVLFEQAIIISRFYSAFFSTLLIPLIFLIGKRMKNETVGLVAAFLATTSVGLIQFAHFGTFELWLTFFTVLLFWLCLSLKRHATDGTLLSLALVSGILAAIKISHIAIIPLAFFVITIQEIYQHKGSHHFYKLARIVRGGLLFFTIVISVYCITNPYVFLDQHSFLGSMKYESGVGLGTLEVFYTGEFFNTIPVIFQFLNVYPFLLNPLITVLLTPFIIYLTMRTIQTKNFSYFLLLTFFAFLLLSQAFLFVKWTRYMVPTLPFVYLIISIVLFDLLHMKKKLFNATIFLLVLVNTIFGMSYFITAFIRPDTRIVAKNVAQSIIPKNAPILSEVYDLGITPFNDIFPQITLFNFYDLDNNVLGLPESLTTELSRSDYIILPSQRVIKPRETNKQNFPHGHAFYQDLFSGQLGYTKIYETPCDIFCQITYLGDPSYRFEETANVFDRPTVYIFKKNN